MRHLLRTPAAKVVLALLILPLLGLALRVAGPLRADPVLLYAGLQTGPFHPAVHGYPSIDPNEGYTSFALGYRAARDLAAGHLPLWNPYEGLGAPLLGEMQSAALFPPTWLLPLPHGQALEQALLQFVAGLGAYLFFRAWGAGRSASLIGGCAWEVNGVFAWLHSVTYNPVAFLPWLLFAVWRMHPEPEAVGARVGVRHAVALGAVAGALALYAGFPEQVFLYTPVLVFAAVCRVAMSVSVHRHWREAGRFAVRLALAAVWAGALSAPLLVAFADMMTQAQLGPHASQGFAGAYIPPAGLLQVFAPYVFGAISSSPDPMVGVIYGNIGGYLGLVPVGLAVCAVALPGSTARVGLRIVLALWIVLSVGASYGWTPALSLLNDLPVFSFTAYFRYLNAGWLFAALWLAVDAIDAAAPRGWLSGRRTAILATLSGTAVLVGACLIARPLLAHVVDGGGSYPWWMFAALLLAASSLWALLLLGLAVPRRHVLTAVGGLMLAEATLFFFVPFLSYPTRGRVDWALVDFLRARIGNGRVVNVHDDVLQPNFGSYFGIAQLNYDDLPTPLLTSDYVRRVLDPVPTDRPTLFKASYPPLSADAAAQRERFVVAHLNAYADAGVRFLLARPGSGPSFAASPVPVRKVYGDAVADVWEIAAPRPYASAPGCVVQVLRRTAMRTECATPSTLTRLEVAMDGWSVRVNGVTTPVARADGVFQAVAVPAGRAEVGFSYRPRYWRPAVAAFWVGASVLMWKLAAATRRRV